MFALYVYSMALQWIGQHPLVSVASQVGRHVSSLHLPSN